MDRADLAGLREGQSAGPVTLTLAEAAALNRSRLVTVEPESDGWRVRAAYRVGVVSIGDLVVRVTPKVGSVQVLTLLARAHGVAGLDVDPSLVDLADDADLSVVLAVLFAHEAEAAMGAGPLRGYRTEEQTLPVLRGRLRMRDQYLRRYGALSALEVTVDEWTLDTDENRHIRLACRRLLELPGVPRRTRAGLLRVDRILADVWLPPAGASLVPWTPTRLNVPLHRLLRLADLVLAYSSVEQEAGTTRTHGFVVDMAWVFEKLVARLLVEMSPRVKPQETRWLDTSSRMTIRPDLVFYDAGGAVAVGDTKYKVLDDNGGLPHDNVNQLVTYCVRFRVPTGHLIYAADVPHREPYDIVGAGIRLVAHGIDIRQDVARIESRVQAILRQILPAASDAAAAGL